MRALIDFRCLACEKLKKKQQENTTSGATENCVFMAQFCCKTVTWTTTTTTTIKFGQNSWNSLYSHTRVEIGQSARLVRRWEDGEDQEEEEDETKTTRRNVSARAQLFLVRVHAETTIDHFKLVQSIANVLTFASRRRSSLVLCALNCTIYCSLGSVWVVARARLLNPVPKELISLVSNLIVTTRGARKCGNHATSRWSIGVSYKKQCAATAATS